MTPEAEVPQPYPKLKLIVGLIIATGVVVSGIWGFFFVRTCDLKDQQIALLEKQSTNLQGTNTVSAIKSLEEKILPLTLAFAMDRFNGRIKLGSGAEGPTEVTMLIIASENLRKEKKFDLASKKLDEIDTFYPNFPGAPYFRFLIEKEKGNEKAALSLTEEAIARLPEDKIITSAYWFAAKANLRLENKKKAEDLSLTLIRLDPKNEDLRLFFKEAFGYEANVPKPSQ
jgi:tetratricopeptide (TPR) repeat protein